VAEQFGTLDALFPGRIDLGLGRAPGTDQSTAHALRRTLMTNPDEFPRDVAELMSYFTPAEGQKVRAVPGTGAKVPIYILGSSLFGAQVAAMLGLPFAFASHFAAQQMTQAIGLYRQRYRPSATHPEPYLILGVNIVAADTDDDARFLASSGRQSFASLRSGMPIPLPPPSKEFEKQVVAFGQIPLEELMSIAFVGAPSTIADSVRGFSETTRPNELMIVSQIYDHAARVRSYELIAQAVRS
jgi:luciferase family oxidoreductase group 1